MEPTLRHAYDKLSSNDDTIRFPAFKVILAATEDPVGWAAEVWDDLCARLEHENSSQRTIAAKVLCNLAKSDSGNRLRKVIDKLLHLTEEENLVVSRQTLQSIWKTAATGKAIQKKVVDHLVGLYDRSPGIRHGNLIRQDIIQSLRNLYDTTGETAIRETAHRLIEKEQDPRYRKKLASCWKGA